MLRRSGVALSLDVPSPFPRAPPPCSPWPRCSSCRRRWRGPRDEGVGEGFGVLQVGVRDEALHAFRLLLEDVVVPVLFRGRGVVFVFAFIEVWRLAGPGATARVLIEVLVLRRQEEWSVALETDSISGKGGRSGTLEGAAATAATSGTKASPSRAWASSIIIPSVMPSGM